MYCLQINVSMIIKYIENKYKITLYKIKFPVKHKHKRENLRSFVEQWRHEAPCRTGNTTAIRHIAVSDTHISRHHSGPIEGPRETPRTVTSLLYSVFLDISPIMPRGASLADTGCNISSLVSRDVRHLTRLVSALKERDFRFSFH